MHSSSQWGSRAKQNLKEPVTLCLPSAKREDGDSGLASILHYMQPRTQTQQAMAKSSTSINSIKIISHRLAQRLT